MPDASVNLQKNITICSIGLKKVIEIQSGDEITRSSMYFDALKYNVLMDGEGYIYMIAYDITDLYIGKVHRMKSVMNIFDIYLLALVLALLEVD